MSDPRPTVAVIIPNYNYERSLGACLEAVFAQTLPPDEVIVVDDGSTDRSVEVARRFPCTVLTGEGNRGPSAARNRGVAASTADILFFLDSDIALEPHALENAVRLLREDPELGCVHGVYAKEPLFDGTLIEHYRLLHNHYARLRSLGRTSALFALAAMPRRVFEEVGWFDESLRTNEDSEYAARLARSRPSLLTDLIAGRHDDDKRLGLVLRKQFERAQTVLPVLIRRPPGRGIWFHRPGGVVCTALTVLTAPLAVAVPALAVLPALFFVLYCAHDPGLVRFAAREKGAAFAVFFVAVNFLVQLALLAGVAVGSLRWSRWRQTLQPA